MLEKWNPAASAFDSLANFAGEIPSDTLRVVLARNRDSSVLAESNWAIALKMLGGESETVQIVRHGHWACGWVEYLMIECFDADKVAIAESIQESLAEYPILDESDYSDRQYSVAAEFWAGMSVSERVEVIQQYGRRSQHREFWTSVFAARREELPKDDSGRIFEYLTADC